MRKYIVVLSVILGLLAAIPAQAQRRRSSHRRSDPARSTRIWENTIRGSVAESAYRHNDSICRRHLALYGPDDEVAISRCRAADFYAYETNRLGRDSRRYGRSRGYEGFGRRRGRHDDVDTILGILGDGANVGLNLWNNRKLNKLIEQQERTQELLSEQNSSPSRTQELEHVAIPQVWINKTGHLLCLQDQGASKPLCLKDGEAARIADATPSPEFGTARWFPEGFCSCDFEHKSGNTYYVVCGK